MNKVVVRFVDGRKIKGIAIDFFPNKDRFHLRKANAEPGTKPMEISTKDLKAVFFVKDFAGNPERDKKNVFDPSRPPAGRKIKVVFNDGEVLVGTTTGYQPGRPGLFIIPADAGSNNERCYVFAAAAQTIEFI